MGRRVGIALAIAGCSALAACNEGAKTPTGQVVATVGNQEITMRDLRAEMGNYSAPDAKTLKAAQSEALRNIVGRDILADEARKEKLDKTPDFAIAKQRAIDSLLAQTLEQHVASQVPHATNEDAQSFIDAHPDIFAQRKVFILDQLQMPRPSDPTLIKSLEPLKTFDQIQALLTDRKIPFKRVDTTLDAVGADPRLVAAVVKLPPGELFVLPSSQIITVNLVKDTKIVPFTGDKAVAYAQQYVTRQRTQEAVQRRIQQLFASEEKNVKFSKDFAPATKPGAPAQPAGQAAPAAASPPAGATASGGQ
jgi:EpsD family peptidyl-prolyl cis-trans isomerase